MNKILLAAVFALAASSSRVATTEVKYLSSVTPLISGVSTLSGT